MELIRISDRKMKIMLTPTDMHHFELNADSFGEDSIQMHRAFRLLLEEVKRRTGFEADDHRISVQYFPSREGGCEMFISNVSSNSADDEESGSCPLEKGKALQLRRQSHNSFHRECAYRFFSLSDLLAVCCRLLKNGYIGSSSAHRDEKDCYYLILNVLSPSPFSIPEDLQFIVEYGSIENAAALKLYLLEHGSMICNENAVHQLGSLNA
ncbi:MAG: adaptor protein MecA [Clostridia bacterium]|nr:adaptor protein MecA [Clostridia bacterium]